jgi:replicative DNA helicase
LRESGSLEQDADNIIFIYADDEEKEKKVIETELIISKQRNGPTRNNKIKIRQKNDDF